MKAEECICCNIDKNNKDEGTGLNNMLCDILFQYTSDEGQRMYLLKCDKNRDGHKKILYHSSSENCYVNIPFQILYLMPNKINRNERLQ